MPKSPSPDSPLRPTAAPPASTGGPHALVVYPPNKSPWMLPLAAGRDYTLGRDPAADIVLDYDWVSQRHLEIRAGDPPEVVDLGSRNGTLLGGQPLAPGSPRPLRAGSFVAIGAVTLVLRRAEEVASSIWRTAPVQAASASGPVRFLTEDPKTHELLALVEQVAASAVSVLIVGETGVGKELLARAIHEHSPRSRRPLVTLNSAAVPEGLVESELFGYERGAFSGAVSAKPGLFEVADGSTFFLDEIGELPVAVQPKLLRVLETGEVLRLGAVRPTRVDVRLVAATNRSLHSEIAAGAFRADLFYRLNGLTVSVPALRERSDDVALLARYFAARSAHGGAREFTSAALDALREHTWPGNVRELKSVVERAVLLAAGPVIDVQHLQLDSLTSSGRWRIDAPVASSRGVPEGPSGEAPRFSDEEVPTEFVRAELDRRERKRIQEALERTGGNQKDAAKLLGMSRRTLSKRLDRYALTRPRKRPGGSSDD